MKIVRAEGTRLEEILDGTFPLWNEGLSRSSYGRWWEAQLRTAWGRTHLDRFALVDGERVLASAKRYELDALLDGESVRILGIGAVFTPAPERGRGRAARLVEEMIRAGSGLGAGPTHPFDFALLFSEIGTDYYQRLGFEPIQRDEVRLEVIEKGGAPATLVRAGEERDLANIAAIGEVMAERFRFHLARPADLVQYAIARRRLLAGLGPHGARELQFFVCEEGTNAVAYVVFTARNGEWLIEECGDRDPAGARVGAMLQVLLAREPQERRPAIRATLPDGFLPPQIRIAETRPAAEIMMLRPIGTRPMPRLTRADVLYWHADVF